MLFKSINIYLICFGESFSISQANVTAGEIKEGVNFEGSPSTDYTNYYRSLHNYIGKDYTSYFSEYLHGDNIFFDDVAFSAPFENIKNYAYFSKNTTLSPLIKDLLDNSRLKNWGIIRKELVKGKYVDSISQNNPMVLMAFDIEGFNMPFRLHVPKSDLIDLCNTANKNALVPEYQGGYDFIVNGEVIPSNIIMPIPKRHRQVIKENSKSCIHDKKMWEHFHFLMNGKIPSHFTETVVTSKNRSIATRKPIIYTDLKTGKRYKKVNNNFLEVEEENVR